MIHDNSLKRTLAMLATVSPLLLQQKAPTGRRTAHDRLGRFTGPGLELAATTPVPKGAKGKPGGPPGAQLHPDVRARLATLGVNKLPPAHVKDVYVSSGLHTDAAHKGALLKWQDDKGKTQYGYSAQFDAQNAQKKWARVLKHRPAVEASLAGLRAQAGTSPAHAAALLIAQTGLRPGGAESLRATGHFGATTMQVQHVAVENGRASISYVGKAGKLNRATVTDPHLVEALATHARGKKPTDRLFPNVASEHVQATLPGGVKTKDLRTIVATSTAERLLAAHVPRLTGDKKADARHVVGILKQVSTQVSQQLNNTPAMARRAYIAPQVIKAWGEKHGLDPKWLE